MQLLTTQLEDSCRKFGLKINADKCRVINTNEDDDVLVENTPVKKVLEFTFLGSVVPGSSSDTKRRIALAATVFGKLKDKISGL